MVASLIYGLAGKLVGELASPLFREYVGQPWELGANDELERLRNTVSAIEAVLIDAEEKQSSSLAVRDWLLQIKLVFYELEDLLEEVTAEDLKRQVMTRNKKAKKVRIFFSSSNQLKYRLSIGRRVKLIREKLDSIASDISILHLVQRRDEMPEITSHRREETHSFVPMDRFVGREADKEHVTKLLLQPDSVNNVSVISIVGIGGMGKTALAQSIYNSEEVKGAHFELMMWVYAYPFDVKLICGKIIESATRNKYKRLQMDIVKDELKKVVDGRKFLLVLDDVWLENPREWEKLELLLAAGAKGSTILITARSELAARIGKSIAIHVLKGLSHEDSWALFKQVAFTRGVEPQSSTIVGIGKDVAERCVGVPLLIKTAGSMLGLIEKETDWLDFKNNALPRITQASEDQVLSILRLSYDYLSIPLKRCFVFCAIYPRDHIIEKETLIKMWMAHGIVQWDGTTRSLKHVGEQRLKALVDRSLLEVHEYDGVILSVKMHDLIHDLARSLEGMHNEYLSIWPDMSYPVMNTHTLVRSTRHAWVRSPGTSIKFLDAKRLRTLIVRFDEVWEADKGSVITGDFKQLRALDLAHLQLARVPGFVDGLRVLNYLDLSFNDFDLLPESIGSLYNLQTLILSGCFNLKKLPTRMRNLVSLRHLDITLCHKLSHMPRGMGELTCLHTLSDFVMGPKGTNCSKLEELRSLVNLRGGLRIRNLRASKVAKRRTKGQSRYGTPLTELTLIQVLQLEWSHEDGVVENEEEEGLLLESLKPHSGLKELTIKGYGGRRIPSWMDKTNIMSSLPEIGFIHFESCKGWRYLPPLGLLPSLRQLYLWNMSDVEFLYDNDEEWDINNHQYFSVLEKLRISNCPLLVADGRQLVGLASLREVYLSEMETETVPGWLGSLLHLRTLQLIGCHNMVTLPEWMSRLTSLQEIRLDDCTSLASIPDCMQHLTSLQRFEVQHCPKLHERCDRETGEDWHKIKHIPNILVRK